MVNIITLSDGSKYVVDVGFGGGGATKPMRLAHDQPVLNMAPAQMVRFMYIKLPGASSSSQRLWVYEKRNTEEEEFSPCYCFPDAVEFSSSDFEVTCIPK